MPLFRCRGRPIRRVFGRGRLRSGRIVDTPCSLNWNTCNDDRLDLRLATGGYSVNGAYVDAAIYLRYLQGNELTSNHLVDTVSVESLASVFSSALSVEQPWRVSCLLEIKRD